MYFREIGSVLAVLPFVPRHGGGDLSRAPFDAQALLGLQPFSDRLPCTSQHIVPAYIADSAVSRAFRGRAEVYPYRDQQGFLGLIERAVKSRRGPRFVYAYWAEYDALGHQFGVSSREVDEHYAGLEFSIAATLARLQGSGATVLITADHGFVDCTRERCVLLDDHPELASMLQMPLCGEPRFAYCYLEPGSEAAFDRYAASMDGVQACIDSRELLAQGWYGLGEPHPALARRIGHRVLVMAPGWQIKDRLPGHSAHCQLGLHGGPSPAEMYVPLVAFEL